jgi:hypothetical protein
VVTISREANAQTEARLRRVFHECSVEWLPGRWGFAEGEDLLQRGDSIAFVRDEGRLSALGPASGAGEHFGVFRVVLPRDADDSGFVGWLCSRIKAATGSGLFVICGHNQERGGIFDYYGVPDVAVDEVRELLARLVRHDFLDGVVMRAVATGADSGIDSETVFCFDQNGRSISARYGGGRVAEGWLVGTLDGSRIRFDYLQVQVDGVVDSGSSVGDVIRLPDGRWRLTEHFTWSSRDGEGTNRLEGR